MNKSNLTNKIFRVLTVVLVIALVIFLALDYASGWQSGYKDYMWLIVLAIVMINNRGCKSCRVE